MLQRFSPSCFSDENGDRPRQLPVIPELRQAIDVYERKESPSWDYDVSRHSPFSTFPIMLISENFLLANLPQKEETPVCVMKYM